MSKPIVILEGGCVSHVVNVQDYDVWDWDDFSDNPATYWEDRGEEGRALLCAAFHPQTIRQIEEQVAEEIAMIIESQIKQRQADPFWMVAS